MDINRRAVLCVLALAAALLSGCGGGQDAPSSTQSAAASAPAVDCGGSPILQASGSTAQAHAMTLFVAAFQQACPGQSLAYQANGSGAGIEEFMAAKTDFGGSDSPLTKGEFDRAQQRCGAPAWNLPMVFEPIAIAFRLDGLTSLNLDGPTAAKIFNGAITTWDDPAIAALNTGTPLPAKAIRVVSRSDESGTTDNFQRYLDTASAGTWGRGAGRRFNGTAGVSAHGNDGVAAATADLDGAITYTAWAFAQDHRLGMANVITSAGPDPVAISEDSIGKTISSAWFLRDGNDLALDTISFYRPNQAGAYPIVLATYEVTCSQYRDPQIETAVRAFLQSAIGDGQLALADHGYVPIPQPLKSRLSAAIDAIT
ncbi:phosphate ABC transporter substrate-binding protein PstS [Mycolicibacter arupensis]|uniref:Phosphate-binding protein n=1 Tax=Mycolicibacter arupensis TaxID=342002 RepID=A0A0F5MYU2_9MYCO|nr:phosphate ABC transporter substrate-binding protein PstS [Mycolicibacter arupensis]KKB99876.1 phosphate-binding protein [Mycolicibacter arupensis]MCV7277209.1 phosphate ABC transporter substrate-binding protein PstS [Mycolicibacter arupensis]OQZ98191.1 phosphate ABC transporter substrate-binding protein PstS [Mycolicibacter arupensis]